MKAPGPLSADAVVRHVRVVDHADQQAGTAVQCRLRRIDRHRRRPVGVDREQRAATRVGSGRRALREQRRSGGGGHARHTHRRHQGEAEGDTHRPADALRAPAHVIPSSRRPGLGPTSHVPPGTSGGEPGWSLVNVWGGRATGQPDRGVVTCRKPEAHGAWPMRGPPTGVRPPPVTSRSRADPGSRRRRADPAPRPPERAPPRRSRSPRPPAPCRAPPRSVRPRAPPVGPPRPRRLRRGRPALPPRHPSRASAAPRTR